MIKVVEISSDADLASFSQHLMDKGVRHRFTQEGSKQILWADTESAAILLRETFIKYRAGEIQINQSENQGISLFSHLRDAAGRFPLTLVLIALNILFFPVGYAMNELDSDSLFAYMMFLEIEQVGSDYYFLTLEETIAGGQWWRFVTPMFVHFSWLHIVFNLLWIWEISRRIELVNGALGLFCVVAVASIIANVSQFMISGPGFFGGMSGVVFGLLGHSLVWSRLVPKKATGVSPSVYIFMLIFLALGFTGVIDALGVGNIANGAHLGGLVSGLITGGLAAMSARFMRWKR